EGEGADRQPPEAARDPGEPRGEHEGRDDDDEAYWHGRVELGHPDRLETRADLGDAEPERGRDPEEGADERNGVDHVAGRAADPSAEQRLEPPPDRDRPTAPVDGVREREAD